MCAIDCSRFDATPVIVTGQSNKYSGELALNPTHAVYCLSDIEQILQGQGSTEKLRNICSITPSNLTEALCPVIFANAIDSLVDSSRLLVSCGKLDAVNECCNQVCQNAVSDVAIKIFVKDNSILHWAHVFPEPLLIIDDFKTIVLRGLSLILPL
ncbi:hypothetical protein Vadar_003269 [Vaccinium darrowii]|uniref:Uncharacterized protein n=1 Tax=Vaccinium darrowii TaxID=229202 RepID=A0ACB7XPA7_9ERIC|nr:hypothetical protein Vadar_003269 [Vaccinium darrowii]